MRKAILVVGTLGVGAVAASLARAQSSASPRAPYESQLVTATDGGIMPVSLLGETVSAQVTGLSGGSVVVSGTVSLSGASLNSVAGPNCAPSELKRMAVTATPVAVPVLSAGRTEVLLHNVTTSTASLSCRPDPGDGGVPDCATPGYGLTIYPTDTATFRFRNTVTIRCRTCPSGDGILEHMDMTCTGL